MNKLAAFSASIVALASAAVLTACVAPVIASMEAGNLGVFKLTEIHCGEFSLIAREHTGLTGHVGNFYYRNVSVSFATASEETRIDYLTGGLSSADDPFRFLEPADRVGIRQEKFIDSSPARHPSGHWQRVHVRLFVNPESFTPRQYSSIADCLRPNIARFNKEIFPTKLESGSLYRVEVDGIVYANKAELREKVRRKNLKK